MTLQGLRWAAARIWPGPKPLRKPAILIGTHHKTGTVWMRRTFNRLAATLQVQFCSIERDGLTRAHIYFSDHSRYPKRLLVRSFRGLHLIRDPRDVILSGMHYHRRASEAWLHRPRENDNGLTYQQKLNSLPFDQQLEFEMLNAGRRTIRQMLAWRYDDPRFFEAKYEDLIEDVTLELFGRILAFLGFSVTEARAGLEAFEQESLFAKQPPQDPSHIRSGRPAQWVSGFNRRDAIRFIDLFGDALIQLGYERDHSWVERVAP